MLVDLPELKTGHVTKDISLTIATSAVKKISTTRSLIECALNCQEINGVSIYIASHFISYTIVKKIYNNKSCNTFIYLHKFSEISKMCRFLAEKSGQIYTLFFCRSTS